MLKLFLDKFVDKYNKWSLVVFELLILNASNFWRL